MKKVLTIALTGVLAAAALAVESDPSNTVGFISQSLTPNGYTSFSACPMGSGTAIPAADVIGGQGSNGDFILSWVGFWDTKVWTADNTWNGLNLNYNGYYLYFNSTPNAQTLVVAGDVIPEGTDLDLHVAAAGAYTGFGNPLPLDIDLAVDDLTLAADGMQAGDFILDWAGFWRTITFDGTTYAPSPILEAGKSYIFNTAAGFTWDYTIGGGALATTPQRVQKVAREAATNLR